MRYVAGKMDLALECGFLAGLVLGFVLAGPGERSHLSLQVLKLVQKLVVVVCFVPKLMG